MNTNQPGTRETIRFTDGEEMDPIPYGEAGFDQTYEERLDDYDRQIDAGGRGRLTADDIRREKEQFENRVSPEEYAERTCHDCGAELGETHMLGCDWEECPRCGGQYIVCECDTYEKRELWDNAE